MTLFAFFQIFLRLDLVRDFHKHDGKSPLFGIGLVRHSGIPILKVIRVVREFLRFARQGRRSKNCHPIETVVFNTRKDFGESLADTVGSFHSQKLFKCRVDIAKDAINRLVLIVGDNLMNRNRRLYLLNHVMVEAFVLVLLLVVAILVGDLLLLLLARFLCLVRQLEFGCSHLARPNDCAVGVFEWEHQDPILLVVVALRFVLVVVVAGRFLRAARRPTARTATADGASLILVDRIFFLLFLVVGVLWRLFIPSLDAIAVTMILHNAVAIQIFDDQMGWQGTKYGLQQQDLVSIIVRIHVVVVESVNHHGLLLDVVVVLVS
mmetsp:Transcript_26193/g.72256  ORF Transcript_26193/g.72256 Transcript_26193/m.72256 type:complete len:321 (-) Transcript_26193:296-1258(-)